MSHLGHVVGWCNLATKSGWRHHPSGCPFVGGARPERLPTKTRVASESQESKAKTEQPVKSTLESDPTLASVINPETPVQEPTTSSAPVKAKAKTSKQNIAYIQKLDRNEQIELLRQARAKSQKWIDEATESRSAEKAPAPNSKAKAKPKAKPKPKPEVQPAEPKVEPKEVPLKTNAEQEKAAQEKEEKMNTMYEQMVASRNRLSTRLSDANRYITFMEGRLEGSIATVQNAFESTEMIISELSTLQKMVDSAAAAVKFGVDKDEAIESMAALRSRVELAHQAVAKEQASLQEMVPRNVPVSWYGVALDVRIMGSFDNWTRGFDLSPDEVSDSVLSEFTAELKLFPGTYEVKFLVNGEWKTAPDWPTTTTATGDTNNIIVVD